MSNDNTDYSLIDDQGYNWSSEAINLAKKKGYYHPALVKTDVFAPTPPVLATPDPLQPVRDLVPDGVTRPGDNHNSTGPLVPSDPKPTDDVRTRDLSELKLDPVRHRPVTTVNTTRQHPVEDNRQTCKPRPKDNKPAGGGGGSFKAFIPWCDRK